VNNFEQQYVYLLVSRSAVGKMVQWWDRAHQVQRIIKLMVLHNAYFS